MAKIRRRRCAWSSKALVGVALELSAAIWLAPVRAQSPPAEVGTTIVDYVAALRKAGFEIAYSDSLLRPDMRIKTVPDGLAPLDALRAELVPYGLALRRGPRDLWLIVAVPRAVVSETPTHAPKRRVVPIMAPPIDQIVVTASRYEISRDAPAAMQEMEQAELGNLPVLGNDALRAAATLPGIAADGISAKFHVRGGSTDETLLYLDGVRLHNPYHLKDFQSPFSGISPRLLQSVHMWAGGFPAEFGDGLSGVVEMHTAEPAARPHFELQADVLSTSVLSSGHFDQGRASWLGALRRSNLDIVADQIGADIGEPNYTDAFGELDFDLLPATRITAGTLQLNDRIDLRDAEAGDASADYDDGYFWLHAINQGSRLTSSYLFSRTGLEDRRSGFVDRSGVTTGSLRERRLFEDDAVKGDWTLALSVHGMLRFGAELGNVWTRYGFDSQAFPAVPLVTGGLAQPPTALETDATIEGVREAAYATYRFRPLRRLTAETGLRWDRQSYLDASELSPRVNLMLDLGARTTLRAAWGRFFQSQDLADLRLGEGTRLLHPPEEADQAVLGFDHLLGQAATLRVEAYRKDFSRLQPRFENLFYRVALLPELLPDRVVIDATRAEATGIELDLDGENGPWSWWLNVAHSSAYDFMGGREVPRSWDQPWSLRAGATWRAPRWTVSITGDAHTGWPSTSLQLGDSAVVAGPLNAKRLAAFSSVDIEATRRTVLAHGQFDWFVELDNALDHANPCCYKYGLRVDSAGRPATLHLEQTNWLPLIPTFGVRWQY